MKQSRLAGAIGVFVALAGVTDAARAVSLSPDGLGQVLIYPYYTVNADNVTLLSVVNSTRRAKAIKVRFIEGYNGQEVVDFILFLSAYDVWTASVFALTATGGGNLLTDDESCTIPDIKGATGPGLGSLPAPDGRTYVLFRNGQYQTDGGPKTIDRTREGHIELIEMASIAAGSPLEAGVTHVNGVPPACSGLNGLVAANTQNLLSPSGGLFGGANIVNPALGTLIGYNADAIDGFYQLSNTLYPASEGPFLSSARTTPSTTVSYNYAATAVDGPNNLITSTYSTSNAIDAVSSVFTANVISNEYVIEANSASESEWVITFPTKKYYVNSTPPIAPFVQRFGAPGISCVTIAGSYRDREERESDLFSPDCIGGVCAPFDPTRLCHETQVLTFQKLQDYLSAAGISAVLGSKLTVNVDPRNDSAFSAGWLRLDFDPVGERHSLRPSTDQHIFIGLPVTGFSATNYLNRNNGNPNVLATYSTAGRHRASRSCVQATPAGDFCS